MTMPVSPEYQPAPDRYDGIPTRRCGRSGFKLPVISLGLWRNSGGVDAFDLGVTHFDLANNYGPPPGSAKETLGRIVRNDLRGYRDELIISTQAGCDMWPGPYGE